MTQAKAEIKRALALANLTTVTPVAPYGADIDEGPAWVVLENGKHVNGVLYRRVKREVMGRIPGLLAGRFLPIKKICSPEFWASLDRVERQQAGRCLMHLVRNKEVSLALVSLSGVSPKLYCKKP
jgi:hypothetical protein